MATVRIAFLLSLFFAAYPTTQSQALADKPCSTSGGCVAQHNGEPYICPKATRTCTRLISPECTVLAEPSDIGNDNTVWIGLVTNAADRPIRPLVVDFARQEFVRAGGLPPVNALNARRPYAFVSCDSTKGVDPVFQHLIGKLNLPAVVGPNYSSDALSALERYTLRAKSLLLASSTSPVFTTMQTNGLFFRTLASDAWQGRILASYFNQFMESELRSSGALRSGAQAKVFLAYRGDIYGRSIADVLKRELRFNGKLPAANGDNFRFLDYGDPNQTDGLSDRKQREASEMILAMRPHVIAIAGSVEAETIIRTVEERWPKRLSYRPRWIGSESVGVAMVRAGVVEPTLPRRFIHANVRLNFDNPIAVSLLSELSARHPGVVERDPRSPTVLALYDSVYAIAYAIAMLGDTPLTGPNIAAALRRLNIHGAGIEIVGKENISDVFARANSHLPFDLQGLSGSLDWDEKGDVVQDFDILCMIRIAEPGKPATMAIKPSGLYFDVRKNAFVGSFVNCPR